MTLADASEHTYLRSTLQQLQDKSWDAKERLLECVEHGDAPGDRHHPRNRRSGRASAGDTHRQRAPTASTGCGSQVLVVASLAAAGAALLISRVHRTRRPA